MGLILIISLTLIILNIIWLFPIKNNSKKEEPLAEIISSLIPNYNTLYLDSLDSSEEICEKNLYNSFKDNTYETFNFKYSIGLIVVLFIQIGIFAKLLLLFFLAYYLLHRQEPGDNFLCAFLLLI